MQPEDNKPSKSGHHLDMETWDAMKAAGFSESELHEDQPFGPIIFAYTRKQAIDDGVLLDLCHGETAELIQQAGIKIHTAMTATAFAETIAPIGEPMPPGQSIKGRLWDVLMMFHFAIRAQRRKGIESERVDFEVSVDDGNGKSRIVQMYAHCGPGDDGEPVLTFMLDGED